jgi:signal peptidase I
MKLAKITVGGSLVLVTLFISTVLSFSRHCSNGVKFSRRGSFSGSIGPPNNRFPTDLYGSVDGLPENKSADNIVTKQWKTLSKDSQDDLKTVGASFLFALIIRVLLVEPRFIPSLSMFPTFDIGDQLLVDKISHIRRPYSKRDVVVFNPSETYMELTGNTEALIKRVVAVAGDTVEVKNRKLYVNGLEQEEPYINEQPDYILSIRTVPAGMLMMLGDNRNHSFDSHVWGFLPEKNVIGRAVVKYWPPWRVGFIEGSN